MLCHGEKYRDIKSQCFVDFANYLHDKKNVEKARKYYERALTFNGANYYAYAGLATVSIENKKYQEALDYCTQAISIKDNDILMKFLLVVVYKSLGETILAEETLKKTLNYFNNNLAAVYNRLSYTYVKFGFYKEAEHYCNEAVNISPNEAGLHNNLAKIYLFEKNFSQAREEFCKVMELTSDRRYRKYAHENIKKIDAILHQSS
jgi:tetratricopeptide (TPR) repeat protein